MSYSRFRLSLLATATVLAVILGLAAVQSARANHDDMGVLRIITIREDQFLNWDFHNQGESVDWPINLLFWNNAEIDKVKRQYQFQDGWSGSGCGHTMWSALTDGYSWTWDGDDGIKRPCLPACMTSATHLRLYAPPATDRFYNPSWGYYVIASSHKDQSEFCFFGTKHGWSEDAEEHAVDVARSFGWYAGDDWASFSNPLPNTHLGNHYLQNDGRASHVRVP